MYKLLPLLWSRSGPWFEQVQIFVIVLVWKWWPSATKCDSLPLLCSRNGAPMLGYTVCCCCFVLENMPMCYAVQPIAVASISKWCPSAEMYDLLRLLWFQNGAPVLGCTIYYHCFSSNIIWVSRVRWILFPRARSASESRVELFTTPITKYINGALQDLMKIYIYF